MMPRGLSKDAQRCWKTLVPALDKDGVLEPEDVVALELLCIAYGQALAAQRVIDEEGPLSQGSLGQKREHPALTTYRASMSLVARYLDGFGVGPVQRARLGVADSQRPNVHAQVEALIGPSPRALAREPMDPLNLPDRRNPLGTLLGREE